MQYLNTRKYILKNVSKYFSIYSKRALKFPHKIKKNERKNVQTIKNECIQNQNNTFSLVSFSK